MEKKLFVSSFDKERYKKDCKEVMDEYALNHFGYTYEKFNEILKNGGTFITVNNYCDRVDILKNIENAIREKVNEIDKKKYECIHEFELLNVCLENNQIVYLALNPSTHKVEKFIEDGNSFKIM